MLSLNQAIEIKESILAYLKATFTFQDKEVHKAFYQFINHPTEGLFKGSYLSLKLPFVKANDAEWDNVPLTIKPDWLPYDHQVKSWHRLSTANQEAQPTIITTGTGSGKTESFMYPVLDYCYRNLSRQGIKVIILYPMNALATDQAKRLAEAIYEDDRIKGKVSAGLFIGEGKDAAKYPKTMGADHIIENRESILASPPDILLTNFKMLDYGLMKSNYNDLWLGNYKDKTILQFLVLDELHTYDGAQGTDVANLIRRLKLKLSIPENHLCPVGTSATIGSGEEAPKLLSDYASKIFGEKIEPDCIITENRLSVDEYFGAGKLEPYTPRMQALKEVKPLSGEGYEKYIERQIAYWQCDKSNLSDGLLRLEIVRDLVKVVNKGNGITTLPEIERKLTDTNKTFKEIPQWDEQYEFNPKEALILSLFALISEAKIIDPKNGRKSPFLYTQTQLWIRELSGLLRVVSEEPTFTWKENIDQTDGDLGLPPWFCRDCGASGWLGVINDKQERVSRNIDDTYTKFFGNHKDLFFLNRTSWFSQLDAQNIGYETKEAIHCFVNNKSLLITDKKDEEAIDITAFKKLNNEGKNDHVCPECNTRNTLSIIGTKIATLSSVAVSQTLATDLDKQTEQDRKVLAFTNSVQDAAHQAGFVEARNYNFTFRASLQKVMNELNKSVSLHQLSEEFIKYWKENADERGAQKLDAYYHRFYPTDYIGKSSPYNYSENGRYEKHFISEFDERMRWNTFAEFGYNALIGRTLEKTASSAVSFNSEDLERVWLVIAPWLNANEQSGTINEESFIPFLDLLLHRIRTRGAISHIYFSKYRENLTIWNLNWSKDNRHFLNKYFGKKARLPRLISFLKDSSGMLDSTHARTTNWFHQYYSKCFQMASPHIDFKNEFFQKLIEALHETEIMDVANEEEQINFALNPTKIYASNQTQTYECQKCGHQVYVSKENTDLTGGLCLNYRCQGAYKLITNNQSLTSNYYQLVYNRNRSPRIYAADHTGLLERKQRELLEIDFKTRPKFNSKNAMVATSTLEMGIDIGSLNTAFNNSIPPQPSNFLQRIGRAGRSTGSALIVNFAKSQAHDLFYFSDPMDMMAGEVSTPGCYIEAKEILKRHFFAFCIDSWTKENPKNHNIPVNLKYLRIETTDMLSSDFFMNKILNFLKVNEDKLFGAFKEGYKKDVNDSVFDSLKYELNNDAFYHFHKQIFIKLKEEIANIQAIKKDIDIRIKDLKFGKEDPERIELEKEKKNLGGIVMAIKKRNTLEHLTNVGALPNYAFPETGVTLSAKVLGNKAIASNKPPLNKDFEIVRSASQAIREFAPDNFFYSQGYRFLITGINTFDWSDKGNFHKKRFCSNCDHIEIADTAEKGNCPKCGHESWGASSNVHTYAKLLSVKSFNNQSDATLNDSGDDRDSIIYNVQRHFNFKKCISYGAFAMKEIPFGIEFIKDVSITEGNLGRKDTVNARKVKINEEEVPAHGFITCKHCGKSSSNIYQRNYKFHYAYCKHKDKSYEGSEDEVFEEIFFFREISTEALKILLPVQELNSESELKMFRAGIELGLKKFFRGNPQHIRLADYSEYNHTTNKFDKYLLLFDSIPGGTGYLEKLFDAKEFSKLLKVAYEEIRDCNCQLVGKDGCYRCIYSYSNQYYQLELSRSLAEKRFHDIYKRSEDWETQPNGLGNLTNIGNIEESELEERFIRSLKKLAVINDSWELNEVNDDGIISYTLSYQSVNKKISYHIRPQVNLGQNDGVEFHTRADFLMICTECEVKGTPVSDLYAIPRIAIYLDGYQFHASKEHNRFANDFQKRKAIANSNNHYSWTLTWDDIELFDAELNNAEVIAKHDFLDERLREDDFSKTKTALLKAVRREDSNIGSFNNNFSRFIELLKQSNDIGKYQKDTSLYLSFFQKKLLSPSFAPDKVVDAIKNESFDNYCITNRTLDGWIPSLMIGANELFNLKVAINIEKAKIVAEFDITNDAEIDKENWNAFWIIYNLLQLFTLNRRNKEADVKSDITSELILDDILSQFDKVFRAYIEKLYKAGKIKTESDEILLYTLLDKNGEELAGAEFFLHEQKVAFGPYKASDIKEIEKAGYKIVSLEEIQKLLI